MQAASCKDTHSTNAKHSPRQRFVAVMAAAAAMCSGATGRRRCSHDDYFTTGLLIEAPVDVMRVLLAGPSGYCCRCHGGASNSTRAHGACVVSLPASKPRRCCACQVCASCTRHHVTATTIWTGTRGFWPAQLGDTGVVHALFGVDYVPRQPRCVASRKACTAVGRNLQCEE